MKKLMFALVAGVAATVATAAPITQTGFESTGEGFSPDQIVGEASGSIDTQFYYAPTNGSENTSAVKAYGQGEAKSVSYNNSEFSGAGSQYLELNTDGGTLYRTINARALGNDFGSAKTVDKSLYIDTLVQFTVCDSAPEIDGNAKLAIWLQASDDETTTNLMVKAKQWTVVDEDGQVVATTATSTNRVYTLANLNNTPYAAGQWYRLTVEDLGNVFTASGRGATGFKILIDGQAVGAVSGYAFVTTGDADATSVLTGKVGDVAGLTDGSVFMSMADTTIVDNDYTSSLCAVGFSGTGAVDNIMFTEDNPFFVAPTVLDFTLTLGANVTGVSYKIGDGDPTATTTNATFKVPVGATITLSSPSFATAPAWTKYKTSVTPGDNVVSSTDTTITLKDSFVVTDSNTKTAAATVNAVADAPAGDEEVAQFLQDIGLSAAHAAKFGTGANTALADYSAFVTWLEANPSYNATRLNDYAYTYERMTNNLPIEVNVIISGDNEVVTSYDATHQLSYDETLSQYCYKVDAGTPLVLSNFVFASSYRLNADTTDETWASPDGFESIAVANGAVTFTPALNAADATSAIGYETIPTYSIKFVWGENLANTNTLDVAESVTPEANSAWEANITGKTFTGWDPSIVAAAADAVYTAQYDVNTYTIKFVYGLNGEYTNTLSSVTYGTTPELPENPDPAYAVSGYDISWPTFVAATADAVYTATYTASAPAVTPVDPSAAGGGEATYDDADKATAAANAINNDKETNIPLPSSIEGKMTSEQKTAYYGSVQAVAAGTKVTIEFTTAGETAAQASADDADTTAAVDAAVTAAAAAGASGSASASVPDSLPGLYYSILSGTSPDSVTSEGDRVLGTGGAISLTVPNKGAAGFYKVKVSPTNK